jgi:hypothetical protein
VLRDPQHVTDHFYQFIYSSGGYTPRRSFLHMLWLCCIWVLWNEWNQRLLSNNVKAIMQLMEKVKITSLSWLEVKNVCFPFGYHMWWQQPLVCLEIDRPLFTTFCFSMIDCCIFVLLLFAFLVLGSITSC